jgi:hypothetical protein
MWGSFAGLLVADLSKAIQAVEELLMFLEGEVTTFARKVGTVLHPDKPDSCKSKGSLAA